MNNNELMEMQNKVKMAENLKASIRKIDEVLKKIKSGKCKDINYEYEGPSVGGCFQLDYEGEGNYTYVQEISAKTLGISDKVFSEWFTEPLIKYLKERRDSLVKEYENLK